MGWVASVLNIVFLKNLKYVLRINALTKKVVGHFAQNKMPQIQFLVTQSNL